MQIRATPGKTVVKGDEIVMELISDGEFGDWGRGGEGEGCRAGVKASCIVTEITPRINFDLHSTTSEFLPGIAIIIMPIIAYYGMLLLYKIDHLVGSSIHLYILNCSNFHFVS